MVATKFHNKIPQTIHFSLKHTVLHLQSTEICLEGEINSNYLLIDQKGKRYIWRVPKDNEHIHTIIQEDLEQTKFLQTGGTYRYRNIGEQVQFMNHALAANLNVPNPIYHNTQGLLLPYIEAVPFDKVLQKGNSDSIIPALQHLHQAHIQSIVFGDRWVKNTLVTQENKIFEVDFDLEITGPHAAEFEIAQTLYHILLFTKDKQKIERILLKHFAQSDLQSAYDMKYVRLFLKGFADHFGTGIYEGIQGGTKEESYRLLQSFQRLDKTT